MDPPEVVKLLRQGGARVHIDAEGVAIFGPGATPDLFEWLNYHHKELLEIPKPTNHELDRQWREEWMKKTKLDFKQRNWFRDIVEADYLKAIEEEVEEEELKRLFERLTGAFEDSYKVMVDGRKSHTVVPQIQPTTEMKQRSRVLFPVGGF